MKRLKARDNITKVKLNHRLQTNHACKDSKRKDKVGQACLTSIIPNLKNTLQVIIKYTLQIT